MLRILVCGFAALYAGGAVAADCGAGRPDAVTVKAWDAHEDDTTLIPSQAVDMTLVNNLQKGVRMIDATISYVDALGNIIGIAWPLKPDVEVTAGGEFKQTGSYLKMERLLTVHHEDVSTVVCLKGVVYDDGTKESF